MLASWASEITDRVDLRQLRDLVVSRDVDVAFPDRAGSEQFVSALRASVEENLHLLRSVLNGSLRLDEVRVERPLVLAALQAQLRIPQAAMQRSYRVGFGVMWEAWVAALAEGAPPQAEGGLVEQVVELTRLVRGYEDRVAVQVAERLSTEEHALAMSRAHIRHRLVESVLGDAEARLTAADITTIAYPFELHHVAVLLPEMAEEAAGRLAVTMADAVGTRHALALPRELTASVVWVGRPAPWTAHHLEELRAGLAAAGARATISEPAPGVAGFRETFTQVHEAEAIRVALGPEYVPLQLSYMDVGLEVLLLRDRDRAARFVSAELGDLAADTAEASRLRHTLAASYRLGSHVATASLLHVHEHTVRNRLRKVEEMLGHPLTERSTEVQVALRLTRLL